MAAPLILLDRDGVINEDLPKGVLNLSEFQFLPRSLDALRMLHEAGFVVAVCTNQSAIEKGWMSEQQLHGIHDQMLEIVESHGGRIQAVYFAPDHPDTPSERRKPGPGMLQEAIEEFGADAANTPFVGDALRDMQAANAAGCPAICVHTGKGEQTIAAGWGDMHPPVTCCDDLYAAAEYVIAHYAPKAVS